MNKYSILIFSLVLVLMVSCHYKCEAPLSPNETIIDEESEEDNATLVFEDFVTSIDENPQALVEIGMPLAKSSDENATLKYYIEGQSVANALSDLSECKSLKGTFVNAINFNSDWDVSNIQNMESLFASFLGDSHKFNQPLNKWNVSKVIDISHMFRNNKSFSQNISGWKLDEVIDISSFATASNILCANIPTKLHSTGCR